MNKDELLINDIAGLVNGIDDKRIAIAALLKMAIAVGCKVKDDDKNCIGCPLTSYTCREINERANMLLMNVDEDTHGDD